MPVTGRRVLVDGLNLQLSEGTGIKVYGLSLLEALQAMGAATHVLVSKFGSRPDPEISTDVLALFDQHTPRASWVGRARLALSAATRLPVSLTAQYAPKDLIVTRAQSGFGFLDSTGFMVLPEGFRMANRLQRFGLPLVVKTTPRMDVWHATYPTPIRVRGAAKITTIHDLIPLRLPQTTLDDKALFLLLMRDAIASSDLLIAVSEATKQDLVRFFGVNPDRIVVTYQAMPSNTPPPAPALARRLLEALRLEFGNYILFVGAIEPKKNLGRLIQACRLLKGSTPLVIVGRKAWLWERELAGLDTRELASGRVRLLDYVPASHLPALYAGASCLAFPSLYEGFGLPALEAMRYGCPVVTSSVASMPEICADAAEYVDPYDPVDIADKLALVLEDDRRRTALIEAGRERAEFFSMARYAERLRDAYERVT